MNVEDARKMSKNEKFFSSHHTFMPYVMQISVYICYAIMNVYVFALIQIKGKAILVFLYDMDINIDRKFEKKFAIKAIILQVILTLIIGLLFYLNVILLYGIQNEILKNFLYFIENMIMSSNFFSLLSLMAYFCYVIQQKLKDLQNEFIDVTQLPHIFKQLLIIQGYVKRFDQFYNKYLFCIFVLWSFECVSSLTILYFDRCKTMSWPMAGIIESIMQIFLYCYLSDKIDTSYMNIINKFELLQLEIQETKLGQINHSLVNRLYSMRDDMCFTAFNLYPINMKTFISILSLIITFTVILIQT